MGFILTAYAAALPEQSIAPRETLVDFMWMILAMALASIIVSYGITHVAKQWRKDNDKQKLTMSRSEIRATLIAAAVFICQWASAVEFGLLTSDAIIAPVTLSVIVGVCAPLSWPYASKFMGYVWAFIRKKLGVQEPPQ